MIYYFMKMSISNLFVASFLCFLHSSILTSIFIATDSIGTGSTVPDMSWGDSLQSAQVNQAHALPKDSISVYDLAGKRVGKDAKGIVVKNNKAKVIK